MGGAFLGNAVLLIVFLAGFVSFLIERYIQNFIFKLLNIPT